MDSDDKAVVCLVCTVIFSLFAAITMTWTTKIRENRDVKLKCIEQLISPDLCNKY